MTEDTGEPPPSKRCKCGAVISGLSDYHLKQHLQGQKHRSGLVQSKPISSFFSPAPSVPAPSHLEVSRSERESSSSDSDDTELRMHLHIAYHQLSDTAITNLVGFVGDREHAPCQLPKRPNELKDQPQPVHIFTSFLSSVLRKGAQHIHLLMYHLNAHSVSLVRLYGSTCTVHVQYERTLGTGASN